MRSINPEMENIYKTTEREKAKWNDYHIAFSADPTPCKLGGRFGYQLLDGDKSNILLRRDGKITLTQVIVYADGTFSVDALGEDYLTLDEVEKIFRDKTLCTSVKDTEKVSFGVLGSAECRTVSCTDHSEKLKEIKEMSLRVRNEPDAHDRCIKAYHDYLTEPTAFYKKRLLEAYEAVPEHERCYLGDMDTRDSDFIRILYTNEKREV